MGSTIGSVSRLWRTAGGGATSGANSEAKRSTSTPSPTTSSHKASEMWYVPISPNPRAATSGSGACRTGLGDVEKCIKLAPPSGRSSPSTRKNMPTVSGSRKTSAVTKARSRKRCILCIRRRMLVFRATDSHASLPDNSRRRSRNRGSPTPGRRPPGCTAESGRDCSRTFRGPSIPPGRGTSGSAGYPPL